MKTLVERLRSELRSAFDIQQEAADEIERTIGGKAVTEKEICELAAKLGDMTVDNKRRIDYCFDGYGILAFANTIAQRTREECAAVCVSYGDWCENWGLYQNETAATQGAMDCAAAIRSMTK